MGSDSTILKWTAAAVGVIVGCFFLGYFVLGLPARNAAGGATEAGNSSGNDPAPRATPVALARITEKTDEVEAKQRRVAEEKKRKAEEAAEKKRLEEEKKKAEEAAKSAAEATPTPDPDATPTPDASPTPDATPTPDAAEPKGEVTGENKRPDEPTPTPTPTPTPKPRSTPRAPKADPDEDKPSDGLHHLRVGGRFDSRGRAAALASELAGRGFPATVVTEKHGGKTVYRVQAGAFKDRSTAEDKEKEISANGYDTSIED